MMRNAVVFAWVLSVGAMLEMNAGEPIDFSHQIVPILRAHCAECHTGEKKKGGFSMNTRESFIAGGEDGKAVELGNSAKSKLIASVISTDPDAQMPPKGPRLSAEKIALLKAWIDAQLPWDSGFAFKRPAYEPPLKPRRPELPLIVDGRENPVDRILDAYLAKNKLSRTAPIGDAEFMRRVSLDLTGLLPEPGALEKFVADASPQKRASLVEKLLADDTAYAEHWMTFWNDLLRNDYAGTGFITGGRKQISKWLYNALLNNMPFDQFARELVAPPTPESAGFGEGIRWRGTVSAGQTVEIQFSQSVSQSFLGINMKCASCHDSFIDRWKLDEAYGLAAVFSTTPLEISRCDKPIGKNAKAAWLFPELGQIDASKPQPERLKQLAALLTHPENGRFTRTIVNRFWHRLMGRGIVHPVDAMQAEPWNADLLDFLAIDFSDKKYDLKHTLRLICTSQAYQSKVETLTKASDEHGYVYAGPRARRMTAEQFVDAVWNICDSAPAKIDAPITRGKADSEAVKNVELRGKWLWSYPEGSDNVPKPGETITLRKTVDLKEVPTRAGVVVSVDNSFVLYINGTKVLEGSDWFNPPSASIEKYLKKGVNTFLLVAKNGGEQPNPAAAFLEGRAKFADGKEVQFATDETWEWTKTAPDGKGHFKKEPADWKHASVVKSTAAWAETAHPLLTSNLATAVYAKAGMARAALMKCNALMSALGRPNRDQIVSVRPSDLSTLEAIDLANAQTLSDMLAKGAKKFEAESAEKIAQSLYLQALSRKPAASELAIAREALGEKPSAQSIQDFMWAVFMLPEFQLVR